MKMTPEAEKLAQQLTNSTEANYFQNEFEPDVAFVVKHVKPALEFARENAPRTAEDRVNYYAYLRAFLKHDLYKAQIDAGIPLDSYDN